jgi:hypothetical protein
MYLRKQVFEGLGNESAFLWGARQTCKTALDLRKGQACPTE